MHSLSQSISTTQYKGFLLIKQEKQSWLIRPKSSPLILLPFRANVSSLEEAKQLLDDRLSDEAKVSKAA